MFGEKSEITTPPKTADEETIAHYDQTRDFPAKDGTSRLGIHLRFGTVSIRKLAVKAAELNATFLNELISMVLQLWEFLSLFLVYPVPV